MQHWVSSALAQRMNPGQLLAAVGADLCKRPYFLEPDSPTLPTLHILNLGCGDVFKQYLTRLSCRKVQSLYSCCLITNCRLECLMIRLKDMTINAHLTA